MLTGYSKTRFGEIVGESIVTIVTLACFGLSVPSKLAVVLFSGHSGFFPQGKNRLRPLRWHDLFVSSVRFGKVVGKSPSRTVPDRTYDCDRSWSPENDDFRYRLL